MSRLVHLSPSNARLLRTTVRSLCAWFVCWGAMGLVTGSLEAQTAHPMTIENQFDLKRVANPKISPDGTWVAYTVATTNAEKEETRTQIWMVPTAGGEPIPLTMSGESASDPEWSPDGAFLSFTATRGDDAETQVWILDRRGGEARPLTDVKQGIEAYEWSPDGTKLALTIRDPEPEETKLEGGVREPWVLDRLQTKRDGTGYLTDDRKTHLYVFDLASETLTQITSGRWDESDPSWSPDGSRIAFVSNRTADPDANSNADVWVVSADNSDMGGTLLRITRYEGGDGNPTWSPDGQWIAYTTGIFDPRFSAFETTHLAVRASDGSGERRVLTEALDRNVGAPEFTPDGKSILMTVSEEGESHVARIDLADGALTRPINGEVQASGFSRGPDGALAAVLSAPDVPGEVFLQRGSERVKLTSANDSLLSTLELAEVRTIHFPSADGTEIEGWVFFPPGYREGSRYPTLLRIHGGPNGMYGVGFNVEAQILAAHGYLVLTTNPRGSSGYGRDFGFALWQKWGIPDFEDVMAGVDYVIEQGWADPARLGVGGWSYGGILTNYVITKTDRFKGAVSGASMGLLISNFGVDHYQLENEREWGLPWENREMWEDLSPWNDIGKVTTPTLFMGGESDWNVPILNSEQLYQALKRRGVDTRLVVYPGQPHGIRPPSYNIHRFKEYLAWYDKYVKGDGGAAQR